MAMLAVLNKRWMSQGWRVMDPKDSEPMALTWIESLDRERIPFEHYNELYRRSVSLRSQRLAQGLKCDDFSVDMMIACWPGLKADLHQRDIDSGRLLTATAPTQCLRCYGTGLEQIYDEAGNKLGVREGCKHEHIDASDPSTAGIDEAINAVNRDETAIEICQRLKKSLVQEWISAEDDELRGSLWMASGKITRVERYIRETETASRPVESRVNYESIPF